MAIELPRLQQKFWISDAYKHLGGQVTARATMSAEIAVKLAALRRTVGVLTRASFKKKAIDRKWKIIYFEQLAMSAFLSGCAAWDALPAVLMAKADG
eukprot:7971331-Prorocentrum_lima.AAC.1